MYGDVISWLRSPDGEEWSRDRIRKARSSYNTQGDGPVRYQQGEFVAHGFFSLKDPEKSVVCAMGLWWGLLPGDDRILEQEEASCRP